MSGDRHRLRQAGELDGKPLGGAADGLDGQIPLRSQNRLSESTNYDPRTVVTWAGRIPVDL